MTLLPRVAAAAAAAGGLATLLLPHAPAGLGIVLVAVATAVAVGLLPRGERIAVEGGAASRAVEGGEAVEGGAGDDGGGADARRIVREPRPGGAPRQRPRGSHGAAGRGGHRSPPAYAGAR